MPDIYLQLCQFFHQDVLVIYPGIEAAINSFVGDASERDLHHLANFLREELSKNTSEMNATWDNCGSDLMFESDGIKKFYNLILEATSESWCDK